MKQEEIANLLQQLLPTTSGNVEDGTNAAGGTNAVATGTEGGGGAFLSSQ